MTIEFGDGAFGFAIAGEGDEGKTAGFAGDFIEDEFDFLNRADRRENILDFVFGEMKGQIGDVEFVSHEQRRRLDAVVD